VDGCIVSSHGNGCEDLDLYLGVGSRAALLAFGAGAAELVVPNVVGAAASESEAMGLSLAATLADFDESPAAKVGSPDAHAHPAQFETDKRSLIPCPCLSIR
jgi:hypothetical protein